MASAQRQTRRSSHRLEDEADGAPPTKKARTEKHARPAGSKSAQGKKAMVAVETNDRVYEQSQDDFLYARKSKRAQPISQPNASAEPTLRAHSPKLESRRSKRLSDESKQEEKARKQAPAKDETRRGREKQRQADPADMKAAKTPRVNEGDLHVERKRRETKIALPFADTPVIQRNRDMRQTSGENRRRSSSTRRGRRASSLIDNGTSNALPHENVETSEFYKHISPDTPEPRRMKQLLTWCGTRVLTERPSSTTNDDVNAVLAARTIQEELLQDFGNKSEMSDWFTREDEVRPTVLVKKPNPRNQQNASKLQELEAEVQRLEGEKSRWDSLLAGVSSSLEGESLSARPQGHLRTEYLEADQVELANLVVGNETPPATRARARLKAATTSLEFKTDDFADGVHKFTMLNEVTREAADEVMKAASHVLQQNENGQSARTGERSGTVGDLLRAFSRAK